jgi:hypothetical protein
MQDHPPFKVIQRRTDLATIAINLLGALATHLYFNVIDPLPTGQEPLREIDRIGLIAFGVALLTAFLLGSAWSRKREARIAGWYEQLRNGAPATDVPMDIRRDVLNAAGQASVVTAVMWTLIGSLSGVLSPSFRTFWGIAGVGGPLTTAMTYFVQDLLCWRPVIPLFFPEGILSSVRAFRLSVLGRLLVVFLLVGIYPLTILTILTWQRAQALIVAVTPQAVLDTLFFLQVFVLCASVVASTGLAVFMRRGIVGPLDTLKTAMRAL